jgi:hypothetical protein
MQLLCYSVQAKKATLSRGWLSWRLWHGRRCGELGNASEPLEAKVRWQRTRRSAAGSDADVLVAQAQFGGEEAVTVPSLEEHAGAGP